MPGVPPNALDVLKKFGKSLFRRNKKPKHVEQPAAPEPEVEETNEAEPPAPYGVPPPPQTPPAPKVSEHAPQIEAPTGFSESPEQPKEEQAPTTTAPQLTIPPLAPAADDTPRPEPIPAPPAAPKVEEAPKAPEPVAKDPPAAAPAAAAPAPTDA